MKLRRLAPAVNSADATTGTATTRPADAVDAGLSGEEGKELGRRSGIAMGSFSCALKCKLQTVKCLTLVGTVGTGVRADIVTARRSDDKIAYSVTIDIARSNTDLSTRCHLLLAPPVLE